MLSSVHFNVDVLLEAKRQLDAEGLTDLFQRIWRLLFEDLLYSYNLRECMSDERGIQS